MKPNLKWLLRAAECADAQSFCLECGDESDGVEPDARGYECDACGEPAVYGVDELLLMGAYDDKAD